MITSCRRTLSSYHGDRSFVKKIILMKGDYRKMTDKLTDIIFQVRNTPEISQALVALCHFIRSAELPAEIAATSWAAAHPQGGVQA